MLQSGVKKEQLEEWALDCQVSYGEGPTATKGSVFDLLEDTDADRCLTMSQQIAGIGRFATMVKNRAFVFIKPHALNDTVIGLVQDTLFSKGLNIVKEGQIDGSVIDEMQLIDK